jgi:biotin carboxyl carrier protein
MKIYASIKDKTWNFDQIEENGHTRLQDNDQQIEYNFTPVGNNRYMLLLNGNSYLVQIIKTNHVYHVHLNGDYFPVIVEDERARQLRAVVEQGAKVDGEEILTAPIPGLITKIKIREGDTIQEGDGLILLEAMKMENEIKAGSPGKIKKILVSEGMPVEKDQPMLLIG